MNSTLLKRLFAIAIFQFSIFNLSITSAQTTFFHRYTVYFTDKNNNPFSVAHPEDFLSSRSLLRRSNQNISVDALDIPVTPQYVDSIRSTGVQVLYTSRWLNCATIFTFDSLALQHIREFPFVIKMDSVANIHPLPQNQNSNSELLPLKTECINNSYYGLGEKQITQVQGQVLHQQGFKGEGMLIASLDAGWTNSQVLLVFDSLRNRGGILTTKNFVNPAQSVYGFSNHGSSTLSAMASNLPGLFVGTAPNADYVLLLSEEAAGEHPVEELNWVAAAEYADSIGADIITSSLGYSVFDTVFTNSDTTVFNHTYADMNGNTTPCSIAAHIASQKGMIVCNSAGNSGGDAWHYITAPSDAEDILCVGAVDSNSVYAPFSGHGPSADERVKPDIMGRGAWTYVVNANTGVVSMSNGTSFSCPLIAGLVACLWQAHPGKTNLEIIDAVRMSGSTYDSPNDSMGYGLANFAYADLLLGNFNKQSLDNDWLKIYPSPFDDVLNLNVNVTATQNARFDFTDVTGRTILTICTEVYPGFNHIILSTQNLAAGIYFMRATANDVSVFEKVVKQ
ncbi:MAG TPA: peptidase S8 [Bacteroidetes bacterium]|nr:peptidase S8 [Bacteroidota bacterium]